MSSPARVGAAGIGVALLRYRHLVARSVLVAVLGFAGSALVARRTYTATASFMPQTSEKGLSRLAGLAAQFGLPGAAGAAGPSPDFYADVLTSRQLLRSVVETPFTIGADSARHRIYLPDYLEVRGSDGVRRERTVDRLRKSVAARASAKTGLVSLSVRLTSPALAHQVAGRMLELLNDFNLSTRQSQAGAERRFVERRLGEVRDELRTAEQALQGFLERNRLFQDSPQLAFQRDRLQREVSLRQQLYASLAQNFEQARIEEVRDTPVITVVERPLEPAEPDRRGLLVRTLIGLVLGLAVGALLAIVAEYARRKREAGDSTYEDLLVLRREAAEDVRRPLRLLRSRR